ncbi:MAG: CHAT domain-containing tetratricopeptide repeat protein [Saprospiraceae bacterium]
MLICPDGIETDNLPDAAGLKASLLLEASAHFAGASDWANAAKSLNHAAGLLGAYQPNARLLHIERLLCQAALDAPGRKWPLVLARADTALTLLPAGLPNRARWEGRIHAQRARAFFNLKQETETATAVAETIRLLRLAEAPPPDLYDMEAMDATLLRTLGQDQAAAERREKTDAWLRALPPFYQASLRPHLLNSLGIDLKNAGRFSDAQRRYEEGLRIFDPQAAISPRTEADLETNLGVVLLRKGRLDEALLHMNRGLDIVVRVFGPESEEAARRYANLANNYHLNGDHRQARALAEKGLGIMRKLKQPAASRTGFYITLINIATDEKDTAATARWLADFGAEMLAEPKDFPPGMRLNFVAQKGQLLEKQGRFAEGLRLLDSFWLQNPPPPGRLWPNIWTDVLGLRAALKNKLGDTEGAIADMKTALRHTYWTQDGQLYLQSADDFHQTSLLVADFYLKAFADSGGGAKALLDSADFYQSLAFHSLHERAAHHPRLRYETGNHFSGHALSAFTWNAHKFRLYVGRGDWLKKSADLVEAASVQNLRDFLHQNPGLAINNLPESTREAEADLRLKITELENAAFDALAKADGDLNAPAYLAKAGALLRLHRQHDSLRAEIARQNPDLHELQFALPTFGVDSIQQKMLRPGQCYLQFFHDKSGQRLDAFLVRPDTMAYFYAHADAALDTLLEKFRRQVRRPDFGGDAAGFAQAARQLGDSLLSKAAPLLTPEIIIAPDAYLAGLSFEALLLAAPAHLARPHTWRFAGLEHAMSYTTSASLLRRQQTRHPQRPPAEMFVGFAPFFEGNADLLVTTGTGPANSDTTNRTALKPLPYSGRELAELLKIMGGKGFFGPDATKNCFLQRAPGARILHLATHGQANHAAGDFSFLTFTNPAQPAAPELLFANEIYDLALVAELVTLSACETGLGRFGLGQGIVGFSRALTCAGARSLLASQWRVNDRHTATLMRLFYEGLRSGQAKNLALREARRTFVQAHKGEAVPYFWASFVLSGDVGRL